MQWKRSITMLGVHAEGEVGRVITGGVINIPGETMLDKMLHINTVDDSIRRFALQEPHGSAQMSVNLLLPPVNPKADVGFIVMQPDAAHALSGSNTMCVTTAVLETGMLPMKDGENTLTIDTPAGLIPAVAHCKNHKVQKVTIDICPSFVEHLDHPVQVEGFGEIKVDVAFGGCYFAMVDAESLGFEISPENARQMVDTAHTIKKAVDQQVSVQHPEIEQFNHVEYVMFTGAHPTETAVYKNGTIIFPGRVDRSPCGTGSSSRMACLHARGELNIGDKVFMESTIGGRFEAEIASTCKVGERDAIIPRLTGRCWIYSIEQHGVHPTDPFPLGYTMSDTWGPDVKAMTSHN
ncbi:Proline racemase [Pseudovibrio sp. W64]|uniref:proline racemase family protein n=1 Tax=Pseudovibrio sp. W64 TaxID=1735583 RepID=UPI0007AE4AC6|nr:proline racemase family protein [Pseudovibrio sp. W64]KZK76880.1 Proline racemase [Pseudovibrio sp. W64]